MQPQAPRLKCILLSCPLTQQPGYQQPAPSPCSRRPVCSTRCNSQPR